MSYSMPSSSTSKFAPLSSESLPNSPKKRGRSSPVPFLRRSSTLQSTSSASKSEGTARTSSPCADALQELEERAKAMNQRASEGTPLTLDEVQDVVLSVRNLIEGLDNFSLDEPQFQTFLREAAHCSHKDWALTDANSERLSRLLFELQDGSGSEGQGICDRFDTLAPVIFQRVLADGNWEGAVEFSRQQPSSHQPWAVLVTGVNGIRKTTSMYQPWFPTVLREALVVPTSADNASEEIPESELPTGPNSFFRQLDHMIATLCNRDFEILYRLTASAVQDSSPSTGAGVENDQVPREVVQAYTNLKAALFSRYRTLSELLGALLLKQAQRRRLNCLMETSGKDIAMFQYVDHFLPQYRKLALRFQINELELAQVSVDARMADEIQRGIAARSTLEVIASNQGGPYGSRVLPSVQADSDAVWHKQVLTHEGVGKDWFMATIQITAHRDRPWTAQAVRPDGSLGNAFEFQR